MLTTSASKPQRSGTTATTDNERRLRKRLQNRVNQRASSAYSIIDFIQKTEMTRPHELVSYVLSEWTDELLLTGSRKLEAETASNIKTKPRGQYQIDRWRLDEHQAVPPSATQTATLDPSNNALTTAVQDMLEVDTSSGGSATWFPLPVDHLLLHLIKYNVFRGLYENKAILEHLTVQYRTADNQTEGFRSHTIFPSYSVIMPLVSTLCRSTGCCSLTPTPLQMTVVHSTWINLIPFPKMRENLIKWEFAFDHSDLVKDLVGDLINLKIFRSASSSPKPALATEQKVMEVGDAQTGLIVWGESYRADAWEATPGFLQKWAWAVADCQELIDSTNHWRLTRGEEQLRLSGSVIAA